MKLVAHVQKMADDIIYLPTFGSTSGLLDFTGKRK